MSSGLLPLLVFVPLTLALGCAVLPRARAVLTVLGGIPVLLLAGALTWQVASDGPVQLALAGWAPPLGIALRLDGWSAALVLMTAVVGVTVGCYATGRPDARGTEGFWPLWLLLWSGLNAVYLTADLFNTYVALELVTLSAVGLIALGGRSSMAAALRYLFVAVLGSLFFLLAVALVYAEAGTLDLELAAQQPGPGLPVAATVLATAGMALKTALVPLHSWLPPAHGGAPSAVSPLMSALVIKASFYVLLRWWTTLPADTRPAGVGQVLGALGCFAIVWGSVMALRQQRLKQVVAYSTVAQVGYLFLLFPLLSAGAQAAALAVQGVLVFALAHGLAKAAMFLASGALAHGHGSDALEGLRGAATRQPVAVFVFAIAGVSLAGLPPTLAFVGKWQLLQASLAAGTWWWFAVLLLGGLLTFAYTARVLTITLAQQDAPAGWAPPPRRMVDTGLLLVLLAVLLGFTGVPLVELIGSVGAEGVGR